MELTRWFPEDDSTEETERQSETDTDSSDFEYYDAGDEDAEPETYYANRLILTRLTTIVKWVSLLIIVLAIGLWLTNTPFPFF